ncbi:MAG: UDP-N-acetylglucosamine 2-epimerase [Microthrixaceae bacterium]|nr:UDP-N-acetylglucosamine 2-epimerase [Microthrixaceae bacterium]
MVLRDVTERPEAVEAGTVRLVGTSTTDVIEAVSSLLTDQQLYEQMTLGQPLRGWQAARRSVDALRYLLCGAAFPDEFEPVGIT